MGNARARPARPCGRRVRRRAPACRGSDPPRQDQHVRAHDELRDREPPVRPDAQPLRPLALARREQRRVGGGRRRLPLAARPRQRRRGEHPDPRPLLRRGGAQAHCGEGAADRSRDLLQEPRRGADPGRPPRPDRRRPRARARACVGARRHRPTRPYPQSRSAIRPRCGSRGCERPSHLAATSIRRPPRPPRPSPTRAARSPRAGWRCARSSPRGPAASRTYSGGWSWPTAGPGSGGCWRAPGRSAPATASPSVRRSGARRRSRSSRHGRACAPRCSPSCPASTCCCAP